MGTVEVAERYGLTVNIWNRSLCPEWDPSVVFLACPQIQASGHLYYEQKMERFFFRESSETQKKKKSCFWPLGVRPGLTMQPGPLSLTWTSLQALPVLQVEKDAWTLPPTTWIFLLTSLILVGREKKIHFSPARN